jgi:hypothetical protein
VTTASAYGVPSLARLVPLVSISVNSSAGKQRRQRDAIIIVIVPWPCP